MEEVPARGRKLEKVAVMSLPALRFNCVEIPYMGFFFFKPLPCGLSGYKFLAI